MEFSEIVGDEDGKSSDWHTSDMPDDVKNALSLAFLDGFHNEVHRLHDELQQEWEEAEDDDLPMEFSFGGVGLKTYELHSLTVSYFEAGVPILCFHHFRNETEEGYQILEWMEENRNRALDEDSEEPYGTQIMQWLNSRRSSITDMARLMDETGLLSHDKVKRVRSHRHDFLHSPLQILYISGWEDLLKMSERCITVVDDLDERLYQDIDLHAFYPTLTDKERSSRTF
ncbi:hypothetical protein [Natrinema halophilum]|uniref:Uncharacterized protein n=1 Tax=Natrinema halophilum TaxID=1699371 RepID=A0A7D5GJI8_9EURY|nr:hypothetical protein [Natrinema halophilum]QLG50668.1 hypothetical protein HYG82_18420 [Natrinema halophilum]